MMHNLTKLVISFACCFMVAYLGSIATIPAIDSWYQTLTKPSFSPPNWLFAPVWSVLYLGMAVAAYLVWQKGWNRKIRMALLFFAIQLTLNLLWSYLFFAWHQPKLAFVEIAVLWVMILLTTWRFGKISQTAAWLLVPYLLWVSFATVLNLSIVLLN